MEEGSPQAGHGSAVPPDVARARPEHSPMVLTYTLRTY